MRFDAIADTVVVAVDVQIVRAAVGVGIADAFQGVRNTVVVGIGVFGIGDAIEITVKGIAVFQCVIDTIVVGIDTAGLVYIVGVVDTIRIAVDTADLRFDRVVDPVVVAVGVQIVGQTVAIGVSDPFNSVGYTIAIGIRVFCIRNAVVVAVGGIAALERIVNAIVIRIGAAGNIDIVNITDAITISVDQRNLCFHSVADAIVVTVNIKIIRCVVTVSISHPFNRIRDPVCI